MDMQRYIDVLEKGDAPNAIVPLIIADAKAEGWNEALDAVANANNDRKRLDVFVRRSPLRKDGD